MERVFSVTFYVHASEDTVGQLHDILPASTETYEPDDWADKLIDIVEGNL